MSDTNQNWSWARYRDGEDEDRVPPGIDPTKPNVARVYDFMLGGKDNFPADRRLGEEILKIAPDAPVMGHSNRMFLRRAVTYMAREGNIRQFLDIGSGLPTQGNVHEIAHEVDPDARVVYVDIDPIVVTHGRALLADNATTTVIQADLRDPDAILGDPEVRKFLDFDRPVGLLLLAILHHVNDAEDPGAIAARFREALAPGSFLVIAHFCNPGDRNPVAAALAAEGERIFTQSLGTGRFRSHEEIRGYFGDLELVEPGLVSPLEWRIDPEEAASFLRPDSSVYHNLLAGVARKS